ncbi:MAG: glycosyl hydrolase 115 family protein [Lachnospiraceae bacterium]|nr:glycosyl hydrolase 115 family protein [Lachnospiraceae bacterium]
MSFTFSNANISENQVVFIYEECAYQGVRTVAGWVRDDIRKVFGARPVGVEYANFRDTADFYLYPVFFGTVGNSAILDKMAAEGHPELLEVAGKNEVYSFSVIDDLDFEGFRFRSAIVIAGSDKRGTIYGLLGLSELIGVSPFTGWLDIRPQKRSEYVLKSRDSFVSPVPSVRLRGFFINDEWPAFGTWCEHNYGGFNAKVYEKVFELLLRLKGNLLWPAMWSSVFSWDGPGAASAKLADELGIIMGTSHHEPCMRQGEEYRHVRGPGSVYGDDWSFINNREGIINFWRDGINARKDYENVYTVGMRGEADTPILPEGTVADNVALLHDVIEAQNVLLREELGKELCDIPRIFAVYKEVEPFYWGDDMTPGLENDPVLEGATILLSDDNYGNLCRIPCNTGGRYGMYYHLDYHGAPVSYEWFNTNYLPKIWEQMTNAYDHGIKDIWIANVGDIFTNEYPLAFFLDLAYDFDRWGTADKNSSENYTRKFVAKNLAFLKEEDREDAVRLLLGYTKITSGRRTEAMDENTYAPFTDCESVNALKETDDLLSCSKRIYRSLKGDEALAFYELVHLPLSGTLNIQKMWILTGLNHAYARFGSTYANTLAKAVGKCIKKDRKIVDKLHRISKGKWYGMGMSKHIGFKRWCEEECMYPVVHTVEPADNPRLIVNIASSGDHTEGGPWAGRTLVMKDALDPQKCGGYIELSTASYGKITYSVTSEDEFIDVVDAGEEIECGQIRRIFIFVDRMKIPADTRYTFGNVRISSDYANVDIRIPVSNPDPSDGFEENTFMLCGNRDVGMMDHITIGAADFVQKTDYDTAAFEVIKGYGRSSSAIKVYPQNMSFAPMCAPTVTYRVIISRAGKYRVRLFTSPANPEGADQKILFGISTLDADLSRVNMLPDDYRQGPGNEAWERGVIENIRIREVVMFFNEGVNSLRIGAISPGFVLEKIEIVKTEEEDHGNC